MKKCIRLLIIVLTIGMLSCKKEKFPPALYISGTENNNTETLVADDSTTSSIAVSVTCSAVVPKNVNLILKADSSLVSQYNLQNHQNYLAAPSNSYTLTSPEVTISAGSNISNSSLLSIKSTKDFKVGKNYLVPVTISSSTGNIDILKASRTIFILIKPIQFITAADVTNNFFLCDLSENNTALKSMNAVSLEATVYVNDFNTFLPTIMGIEENLIVRFSSQNQLQQSGQSILTSPQPLSTNTWYHVAFVYDGTTEKFYLNGAFINSAAMARPINLTPDPKLYLNNNFYIGYAVGGRMLDGKISEARIWSKALSQNEIVNGQCGVDPSSPNLEAYWKFNEGKGNTATDLTGHGHNATAAYDVNWVPSFKCQ